MKLPPVDCRGKEAVIRTGIRTIRKIETGNGPWRSLCLKGFIEDERIRNTGGAEIASTSIIKVVENFRLWINACGKLKNVVDLKFSDLNSAGREWFSSRLITGLMKEPFIALCFYCTKNPEAGKPYGTRDCAGRKGNSKTIVLH